MRSCTLPVSAADGKRVTTIEGLAQDGTLHKMQQAWVAHQVPQCGYCQSGMIMAVAGLLAKTPQPTDEEIDAGLRTSAAAARSRAAVAMSNWDTSLPQGEGRGIASSRC